jgi:peptide/nickel transport system permease protein
MATQTSIANLESAQEQQHRSQSLFTKAMRRLSRDYLTLSALAVVLLLTFLSLFGPWINANVLHIDPDRTSRAAFAPYGTEGHILGTDEIGRDQLARLLVAGQVTLGIGFVGAFISLSVGVVIGVIAGYFGGIIDDVLNWIITTLDSIPSLYLLILISAVLVANDAPPDARALIIVIALISWTGITRIIRGQTLAIRNLDYILSAQALGASPWHIMFIHIIPNLISITAIVLMRSIGGLMLTEASLSFLGLGVQPPQATWGNMLTKAQSFFTLGPHLIWPPGIAISVTVLCLYIIGDGIRDAFDPTSTR